MQKVGRTSRRSGNEKLPQVPKLMCVVAGKENILFSSFFRFWGLREIPRMSSARLRVTYFCAGFVFFGIINGLGLRAKGCNYKDGRILPRTRREA